MKLLDLTLPSPAENVALDEALLEAAEAGELTDEVLRFWESPESLVVVGRSSKIEQEINLTACRAAEVPVLRRASGGAAIVAGPGCLMYAVILRYGGREHLRLIDEMHRHVLGIVRSAIEPLATGIEHVGTSDLAIGSRKFSGNSVRCKRDHLLYHGTLLYGFDLTLVAKLLTMPPRQPKYRGGRQREEFVANLAIVPGELKRAIAAAFGAEQTLVDWPRGRTAELVAAKYSSDGWNFER